MARENEEQARSAGIQAHLQRVTPVVYSLCDQMRDRVPAEMRAEGPAEWNALFTDCLLDQISCPRLAAVLRALPAQDLALLELCFVRELSYADIARSLNTSRGAVKVRCNRVIRSLRRALGAPGDPHAATAAEPSD
jgi:sigma-70-like protein